MPQKNLLYQLGDRDNSIETLYFNPDTISPKRIFDLLMGLICLVVFSPVIIIIAILIMLDSPGNPFFKQVRAGRNGKYFNILKFRTLFIHHFGIFLEEEHVNPNRITRVGKFLRRSKLDELPQLVNIIFGDMSFVGPRPDIIEQVNNYTSLQRKRLLVKPGLTGISQISGNTMLSWPHRIWLDNWYIQNKTWLLDTQIIFLTIVSIFRGETPTSDPFNLHAKVPPESK